MFEFDSSEVAVSSGSAPDSVEVEAIGVTMTFFGVEQFAFNDLTLDADTIMEV
ncbi:MAG: hypothetical protein AAF383_10060 [Cyanobacteria bacterium P01_A01_bin.83]